MTKHYVCRLPFFLLKKNPSGGSPRRNYFRVFLAFFATQFTSRYSLRGQLYRQTHGIFRGVYLQNRYFTYTENLGFHTSVPVFVGEGAQRYWDKHLFAPNGNHSSVGLRITIPGRLIKLLKKKCQCKAIYQLCSLKIRHTRLRRSWS